MGEKIVHFALLYLQCKSRYPDIAVKDFHWKVYIFILPIKVDRCNGRKIGNLQHHNLQICHLQIRIHKVARLKLTHL